MCFQQLATLLITRQVIGNLREAVIPFILWKLKLIKVGYDITAHMSPSSIENEIKIIEREIVSENCVNEKTSENTRNSERNAENPNNEDNFETIPCDLTHRRGSEAVVLPGEITGDNSNVRARVSSDRQHEALPSTKMTRTGSLMERQSEELKRQCSALILTQAEMESTMTKVSWVVYNSAELYFPFGSLRSARVF